MSHWIPVALYHWFAVLCVISTTSVVNAEVRIQPGDTLRVSVLGHNSLSTEVTVDPAGTILLPLIGELSVGYLSLDEIRRQVTAGYSGAVYQIGEGSGAEIVRSVDPTGVTVDVASYRPIYVHGDVLSPGPAEYRPGLTVLQAVASVGGPGRVINNGQGNELAVVRLHTEISTLRRRIEIERQDIARLRGELQDLLNVDGEGGVVETDMAKADPGIAQDGWNLARQRARLLRDQTTQETVMRLQSRLEMLKAQEENANRAVDLYAQRVEEVEAAAKLRPIETQTVLDARLALLLASSRALGIGAERGTVEVDLSRARLGDTFDDQVEVARLIDVISGKEAELQLSVLRLQGLNQESQFLGAPTAEMIAETQYFIFREAAVDEWIEFVAQPQARVEPGDVIEVSLSFRELAHGFSTDNETNYAER